MQMAGISVGDLKVQKQRVQGLQHGPPSSILTTHPVHPASPVAKKL